MPDDENQAKFVTHKEFREWTKDFDAKFDHMTDRMSEQFRLLNEGMGKMVARVGVTEASKGSIPLGSIGIIIAIGAVFSSLVVVPLSHKTNAQEDRIWNLETSYVPESVVVASIDGLRENDRELSQTVYKHTLQSAERWGRTDTELSAYRHELTIIRAWQIAHDETVAPLNASQWSQILNNKSEIERLRMVSP
ncbi:MAG: hypothetical protein JKY67_00155 [Pseudomonadales bacterium]|nr:hypothetical protein [Pseudomonadales bacterium]